MTPNEIIREGRGRLQRVTTISNALFDSACLSLDQIHAMQREKRHLLEENAEAFPAALDALEEATKETERCRAFWTNRYNAQHGDLESAWKDRDAAIARAERAEAALAKANEATDEARRMYCELQSRACPHVVARSTWGKAEADRLFPAGGGK